MLSDGSPIPRPLSAISSRISPGSSSRDTFTYEAEACLRMFSRASESTFLRWKLTTREREVLKLIAEGKSNRQIAEVFYISVRTVENHRANILKKLNLKKTADLDRYAIQKGIT